jgi:hypothetical protein
MAPREVVMGLDKVERGVSIFGSGIALIVSGVYAVAWVQDSPVTTSVHHVKGKSCPSTYSKHVGLFCEHVLKEADSYWAIRCLFPLIIGLLILLFAILRKRAGVACFALFLGVAVGAIDGAVFIFLGAWLIIRAFRLQRYGEASWTASNKAAREIAQAKKEGRAANLTPSTSTATSTTVAPSPKPLAPPTASKRYTPKQKPRKR